MRHLVAETIPNIPTFPYFSFYVSSTPALAVEERARQLQVKVHPCRPSVSRNPEIDLKTKREVGGRSFLFALYLKSLFSCSLSPASLTCAPLASQMYAEQRRSSDNMSARSSDSDMSDVSALSRASSASRLSSTSYMSIQSERPRGRLRSVFVGQELCLFIYLQSVYSCCHHAC